MKLLNKLTNRFIAWSLLVMVLTGTLIYFILSVVINRQMDERLAENLSSVEQQLARAPETVFFDPVAHVEKTHAAGEKISFSDTLIYNESEQEYEDYRQISAVKNIDGEFYRIVLRKSKIESEDFLVTLAIVTIFGMIMLWLILLLITRKLAKSLWQPFFTNLEQIKSFSVTTQKALDFKSTGIFEFDELNEATNKLTRQIISDFQNQKQFSEDVSHELQTPLAIISSRLESLLGNPELKDYTESLNSIYGSVRRLSKLNKAMILLSKIENNQFASDEYTSFKKIVKEKLDEFSELISLKELQLESELANDLMVSISPSLAEILINNLLSNSINHTAKGGKIIIELGEQKMLFCNTGTQEITESHKLFNRFHKDDPSSQSVGLGLAIVKKICDLHQLKIRYFFDKNLHYFEISTSSSNP